MNPLSPHHLLSAYLDGELSAGEREDVERLLEESPEARQELQELEQVGEWLRQLPREALPQTFAPSVLDVCQADTGEFDSETLLPESGMPFPKLPATGAGRYRALARKRKKSWLTFTSVVISASVLGLMVLLALPKPHEADRKEIATHTPAMADSDNALPGENFARELPLAAEGTTSAKAFNEARFQQQGQPDSAKKQTADLLTQFSDMAADAAPGGNQQAPIRFKGDLKDAPVGQVVEALDHQGERIAVVKLVVVDRQQGLKDLQVLLQRHHITHEDPKEAETERFAAGAVDPEKDASLLAVYVETSEDRLAAAMQELQKQAAFQKLTMETPIEVAQFDPILAAPNARFRAERRSRQMRFGGTGDGGVPVPGAFRAPQAMKAETVPPKPSPEAPPAEKTSPGEPTAKPKKAEPKAPANPAKNRSFGAASSNPLPELEKSLRDADRAREEAKPKLTDKETAPQTAQSPVASTQRKLTLSADDLTDLQGKLAEPPSASITSDETATKRGGATTVRKPMQVLFVLVEQSPSSAGPTPTPAANSPPTDENGAA